MRLNPSRQNRTRPCAAWPAAPGCSSRILLARTEHWLPPDHFQETPQTGSAPYTSPTNIGLLLLSTLAAYDLGYIGIPILVSRLRSTFESLERLERLRGHFLNWYDTRTLEPMPPRYVSTVDSGNLAACLRILGQACQQIPGKPVLRWQGWEGVADTFAMLDDFVRDLETAKNIPAAGELRVLARELRERVLSVKDDPDAWLPALEYVAGAGWQRLELLLTRRRTDAANARAHSACSTGRCTEDRRVHEQSGCSGRSGTCWISLNLS